MKKSIILLVFSFFILFLSVHTYAETPREGLKAIIELYKTKNFKKLVQERYSELERFGRTEDIVNKLTEIFRKRYSNDKLLARTVSFLERALKAKPLIVKREDPQKGETGDVAKFKVVLNSRTVEYRLYKMKTGLWGFHL